MSGVLKRITLSQWIILSMVIGVVIGVWLPEVAIHLDIVSNLFLHLIKCIVVPLIFSTLVVGIAGHTDDMKAVGRLALKSLIYFEVVTTAALVIGLVAANWIQPGAGINESQIRSAEIPPPTQAVGLVSSSSMALVAASSTNFVPATTNSITANVQPSKTKITFAGVMEELVPQSFFDAAAKNNVLQVVTFSILFAVSLARAKNSSRVSMLGFCESLSDVMFKFTGLVMFFAPFGVGAAIAYTIGINGFHVMLSLGKLVLTLYASLFVFIVAVLIPIMLMARIPVLGFLRAVRQPALLAFSTASSEAALPDALRLMEKFGVPRRIVSFVLPMGYSFNLDGSTLYLALAALFVAQAGGMRLSLAEQLPLMLTLMLTSKGVAAVPRASVVVLMGALATFHLPAAGVALILSVDAFLDMARTSINLFGNCLASAVMARWEGEFRQPEPVAISDPAIETFPS